MPAHVVIRPQDNWEFPRIIVQISPNGSVDRFQQHLILGIEPLQSGLLGPEGFWLDTGQRRVEADSVMTRVQQDPGSMR